MTPQAPRCFQYCSPACSQAISDTARERWHVGRGETARDEGGRCKVGRDKRTTGEVEEWQIRMEGQKSWGGVGGLR